MNWLWLNIPLMAVFFLARTAIPLWLVRKHPDTGPAAARLQIRAPRDAFMARYRAPHAARTGQVPALIVLRRPAIAPYQPR